ncbi:SDR family oxidoreductase [Thalassomonas actiniarum]|uniref:SDR family oxidoreductase n=1 Tax=Thalassomonas actiniarum TaxID=485447 RepID=A0AAE9YR13_9GAMM|nr:SDR family oxidoreductase [Thalassomonas actiniarum]WDD98818.1 SDR family oxidoreductase [Thalassomonas actiniarum]
MSNILIIGAAGANGQATLHALFAKADLTDHIIAGVRSEEKAKALKNLYPQLETRVFDIERADELNSAMQGVDKVFYIPGNIEPRELHAKAVIDTALAHESVKDFVFYSVFGAEYEGVLFARQFRYGEKYLEDSRLNWTHLRTIFFQDNLLGWAEDVKNGTLHLGTGKGRFAPLLVQDIGEIAANILTSQGHAGKAYNITGPELVSGVEIAEIFANELGKTVSHISPDNATTLSALTGSGWPEWQAKGMVELFNAFADDQAAMVSPDGEQLLGRPLTPLKAFVKANKASFS